MGVMKPLFDLLGKDDRKIFCRPNNSKPAMVGLLAGMIIVIVLVGSYNYSGSPSICSLCHSMANVHAKWRKSKHKQFACTECHMPAANILKKAAYKTKAGINDLVHEILRDYPAYITLSPHGRDIVNGNCIRCHFSTVENTMMAKGVYNCSKCHRNLVHGKSLQGGGITVE